MSFFQKRNKSTHQRSREQLIQELAETNAELQLALSQLDFAQKPLVIEEYAFRLKALEARFRYLWELLRKQDQEVTSVLPVSQHGISI